MADKKTPAVPAGAVLKVQVVSRAGKGVAGADVTLDSPATSAKTNASGFASIKLTGPEIDALSPAGKVTLRIKKRHHGPLPAAGAKVVPSAVVVTAQIEKNKGFADATPGLVVEKDASFLRQVLVDAGYNFGTTSPGTPTRRLTDAEVQMELLAYHAAGDAPLSPATEIEFTHDATSGEFAACDPAKCVIARPTADKWVTLQKNEIAGVAFFYLASFVEGPSKSTDKMPAQRFLRDKLVTQKMNVHNIDQRHMVGLVRLCKKLKADHGIAAIFTQGMNGDTTRKDCHGHGCALDFAGAAKALPDPLTGSTLIRMGVDFVVYYHWGRVPMWDAKKVAADPTNSSTWTRQSGFDDGTDYTADPKGTVTKLHYRLDPAPFQEPPPAAGTSPDDAALATQLATIAPHFVTARALFRTVFEFATAEYSDRNKALGPLPPTPAGGTPPDETPTPIDAHSGHFILHPDYGKPNAPGAKNGRQAHVNHLHFQVGPTSYPDARTA